MRSRKLIFLFSFFAFTLFAGSFPFSISAEDSPTYITEDITGDTTWTLAGSPYVLESSVSVLESATLTIEPGVIVKTNPLDGGLNIFGSLLAEGTSDNRIYFTSLWDDSVGGDTNGDGNATVPNLSLSKSLWGGIYFDDAEEVFLEYVDVSFSKNGFVFWSTDAFLSNIKGRNNRYDLNIWEGSYVSLSGGDFYGSYNESIYLVDSMLIGDNITVEGTQKWQGFITFNSDLYLTDSLIQNMQAQAIGAEGPGTVNLERVNIKNTYGVMGYSGMVFSIEDSTLDNTPIQTWDDSTFNIDNSIIQNSSHGIEDYGGDTFNITKSKIINNSGSGIYLYSDTSSPNSIINVSDSVISGNTTYGIYNGASYPINAVNVWWGDASGPYHETLNPEGLGDSLSDNVLFDPWCVDEECVVVPTCTEDCFSNILFLPGLMGSRLYEAGLDCGTDIVGPECGDQELWVSSVGPAQSKLALDNEGKSVNDLYTKNDTQKLDGDSGEKGIVDELTVLNIYKSFINDLKGWKDEEMIEDYALIPYDWRLSLEDIITNGSVSQNDNLFYDTPQDFSESFILQKLDELQASSKSGEVTIIAHSNGGLVAKALVQKLKDTNNPLYDKIDKIIFVAVPQVGTPDAVTALLHGNELGYGFIMKNDRSRQLSENMPTIYNLLPSAGYFSTVDPAFAVDKVISFEDIPFFDSQISEYGVFVSDETELKNYILGTDGRSKPDFSDTKNPNIGNSTLYTESQNVHQILDSWQPSPDTEVIQIAGWGEETLAGLDYKSYKSFFGSEYLSYKPRWVVDGDGVVVVPSALWMSDSNSNVERWWVDLTEEGGPFSTDKEHRDILEILNLRDFIKTKIKNSEFADPDNIIVDNNSTLVSDKTRLHFTLHSPLALGITDSEGRYTGMDPATQEVEQEVPDVTYKQIGEVQFLSVPSGTAYTLELQGYAEGSFSLDIDKQTGNTVTESISFEGVSSSLSTSATIDITPSFEVLTSELQVDQDGDGNVDQVYQVVDGETQITNSGDSDIADSSGGGGSSHASGQVLGQSTTNIGEENNQVVSETDDVAEVLEERASQDSQGKLAVAGQQVAEAEIPNGNKDVVNATEEALLTASAGDSGFGENTVPYVIILGVFALYFLLKIFIKI